MRSRFRNSNCNRQKGLSFRFLTVNHSKLYHKIITQQIKILCHLTWCLFQNSAVNTMINRKKNVHPTYGSTHHKSHKMVHRAASHTVPSEAPFSLWACGQQPWALSVSQTFVLSAGGAFSSFFTVFHTAFFSTQTLSTNLLLLLSFAEF